MRHTLASTLVLAFAAGIAGGAAGPPDQPYAASYATDRPPFYSDEVTGRAIPLNHPYRCVNCGWFWR